ncbi:MAG: cytidylate kinase [Acidimicrobiales bacterium]|nr:MAG: cytidylate kinase [Acidimicrobiales bacterium]
MTVVAIDGPAGTGKSTVARILGRRLGLPTLDTGAMYRAVAAAVLRAGVDPSDHDEVAAVAARMDLVVEEGKVTVDGIDVTEEIRKGPVNRTVSTVAANPRVRLLLQQMQRDWVRSHGGGVVEGRDIGTVVLPDADLKVYLDARPEIRARRRAGETGEERVEVVARELSERDEKDSARSVDPLKPAPDALVIDTSDLSVDEVVEKILGALGGYG